MSSHVYNVFDFLTSHHPSGVPQVESSMNKRETAVFSQQWSPSCDALVASMMKVSLAETKETHVGYLSNESLWSSSDRSSTGISRSSNQENLSSLVDADNVILARTRPTPHQTPDDWGYFVDS